MLQRNYSEIIIKDLQLHEQLIDKGYFTTKALTDEELAEIKRSYERFSEMIEGEELTYFSASCNVKNKEAVRYSKDSIDHIFSKAFDRILFADKVEYTGGVFLMKSSGDDTYHNLHQDIPIIDETQSYGLYSWTPITKTGENSGKMFVVPGSNYGGTHQRSHLIKADPLNEEAYKDKFEVVDVKQGETLFFDSKLMHGSLANTAGYRRVAVSFFVKPKSTPCIYYSKNEEDNSLVDVYEIDPEYFFEQEHHKDEATGKHLKFLRTEKLVS